MAEGNPEGLMGTLRGLAQKIDRAIFGNPGIGDKLTPKQQQQMNQWDETKSRLRESGEDIDWREPSR